MMRPQNELQERYFDLMRLQRSVNGAMDTVAANGQGGVDDAAAALRREVEKLVRTDAGPEIFAAIERAAWEAPEGAEFAQTARIAYAQMRLKSLTDTYGSPTGFRKSISDAEEDIKKKESRFEELKRSVAKLDEQLEPVRAFNEKHRYQIGARTRKEIEGSSFWSRSEGVAAAYPVVREYAQRYAGYSPANCFDDMERVATEKQEIENLGPQLENMRHAYIKRLSAYTEMDAVRRTLADNGVTDRTPFMLDDFRKKLADRLCDRNFVECFARQTGSGIGGPVILAALNLSVRKSVQDDLGAFHAKLKQTTALLEGPIGSIARAAGQTRTIDGIERDVKAQAVMAGYLSTCASDAWRALENFRPAHTEGPQSLERDLQMHMIVNGDVDPAYLHNLFGLDRTLTKIFNVNAVRPKPAFEKVLADPVDISIIDRHYAAFLTENAADPDVNAAGFAAGQFDIISFEKFLGRYFPTGTTFANIADALAKDANEIEDVERQREEMGISRGGPSLPGVA